MTDATEPWRALLDHCHDQHCARPRAFADEFIRRAPQLPTDAEGAEAIRLAEHVMLAHLADAGLLRHFIARLPPSAATADATAPSVQRAAWAIAKLGGEAGPDVPDLARWRGLHNVVLAAARHGQCAQAQAWLADEEAAAQSHADSAARQAYAACANNVALELRLGERGHPERDELMLAAAAIARRAWASAGTWTHVERAEYQLALCHAVLGQGPQALVHARQCLAICEAERADAAEHFFAHEALVLAQLASGDGNAAQHHRRQMEGWLPQVVDEGLRQWCTRILDALPA